MSVLFVTACSLTKEPGGTVDFNREAAIAAAVPRRQAEALAARRREVLELALGGRAGDWQGVALRRLEYNRGLVQGPDFGGRRGAHYLAALDRYQGRFFRELRDVDEARRRAKRNTLIVSGLYGLLRASEPIQLYSCPLLPEVANVWQRDELLTDILCGYIERNDIRRVFDLTAMDAYRDLIEWDRVTGNGTDVLHCFDTMAAGESGLTSFGWFFRYLLSLNDRDLAALEPGRPRSEFRTCRLHEAVAPPPDYPRETWPADMAPVALRGGNPDAGPRGLEVRTPVVAEPWRFAASPRFRRDARRRKIEELANAVARISRAPVEEDGDTITRLTGHGGRLWRYRRGSLRLVYQPERDRRVVYLLRFDPRGDVYNGP